MKETRYYSSYEDDFEESANQNYALPERRDEGLRLLHGLETNLAASLQTPQEA